VPDEFLTVAEVAAILKPIQQTVRNWIDAGMLPAVRVGRRVRIKRSEFDAFVESSHTGPRTASPPRAFGRETYRRRKMPQEQTWRRGTLALGTSLPTTGAPMARAAYAPTPPSRVRWEVSVPGRVDVVERIAELVGGDVLRISQLGTGWPSLCTVQLDDGPALVAVFAAPVGLSHRDRDDVERRFQNPGSGRPIVQSDPARRPLLLGLWESDPDPGVSVTRPLLVSADPFRRIGRTTRFSVFVSLSSLRAALVTGWSQDENSLGETIRCLSPPLLPISYMADRDDAVPAAHAMHAAIDGSGLLTADINELPAASERARRAGSALVRDARSARG
jgi:excisionase family DNA binding protein